MSTDCQDIQIRLGELLDGELQGPAHRAVEDHLASCGDCRRELARLESLARQIASPAAISAPAGLWAAIESRLERGWDELSGTADTPVRSRQRRTTTRSRILRLATRPLAAAAAVLLVVGLSWMAIAPPRAMAAEIDFRPLLEQANGDVSAGIQALMRAYGGQPISARQAAARMTVRIAAPAELPDGLRLEGRYLQGRSHTALAFHYTGARGKQLLLLQCPPQIERDYGGYECMACSAGDHEGQGVHVGNLRLMHMASDNVCICVGSTLDKPALDAAMNAVHITF